MKWLLLVLLAGFSMGAVPVQDGPQIPQALLTFHLAIAASVPAHDRALAQDAFHSAVAEWELLTPAQARFSILPDSISMEGPADFEVRISPDTIDKDVDCLGMYDGHYKKDHSRIYGTIYVISEWGHWEHQAHPMDFWDYKFVMMHEIGHLLGLGHHDANPHGIMNYFDHALIPARLVHSPSSDEIEAVKTHKVGLKTEVDKLSAF